MYEAFGAVSCVSVRCFMYSVFFTVIIGIVDCLVMITGRILIGIVAVIIIVMIFVADFLIIFILVAGA